MIFFFIKISLSLSLSLLFWYDSKKYAGIPFSITMNPKKISLEMPGIEPGASYMQSMRSTTELHPLTDNYCLAPISNCAPKQQLNSKRSKLWCVEAACIKYTCYVVSNLDPILITRSLYSSVAEHWSCKPGVESSILSGGINSTFFFSVFPIWHLNSFDFHCDHSHLPFSQFVWWSDSGGKWYSFWNASHLNRPTTCLNVGNSGQLCQPLQ